MGELEKMFADQVTAIGEALGLEGRFLVEYGFEQIMAKLLPPPPEMETVEVERFLLVDKVTGKSAQYATCGDDPYDASTHDVVKLTGHFQRPKPVKVERSVELWFDREGGYEVRGVMDFTFYGKRGHFRWQE
jgi:hypothetical protein